MNDQKLISDEFEQHDKVLNEVCQKFNFAVRPDWRHKWFFRFLQISASYRYVRDCQAEIKSGGKNPDNYKDYLSDYDLVNMTYQGLYDVWHFDFVRWWATFGQLQFSKGENIKFRELALIQFGKKYDQNKRQLFNIRFQNYLDHVIDSPSFPDTLILGVTMDKSKNVLIREFIEIMDRYNVYPQENTAHGNFFIKQSKLKESALRDCYRTFELRIRFPEISLIELAKMANTLKTSLAGIKDDSNSEAAKSVRSGIKNQLTMAINLAEAAARSSFPHTKKGPGIHSKYLQMPDYFMNLFNIIQEITPYKTQDVKQILSELPNLIEKAKSYNLDSLERLY